ncbi:MAG: methylmalonyl Co-A mutase-associated GTPase MeaB [Bacteroidetes bacterium]|nr:methylmalonyl Co-A mutase-associated GTPase MeaB [Bacteroidota bacterium]
MFNNDINNIVNAAISGNRRALSRIISYVESDHAETSNIISSIKDRIWNAYRIGITGPPGAGKSTLTNELTKLFLSQNKKVAIVAVDPTSPFSGGALLGDRIRMNDIGTNNDVFIRSMATRGSLGGLSKKTNDVADILSAIGYDIVIIETVGVGQSELDIATTADTTIVAIVPESGDSIQAMKAGLMEIADLYVINKSDRPGAEMLQTALSAMLSLKNTRTNDWHPTILQTVATDSKGITEMMEEIFRHKIFLEKDDALQNKRARNAKLRVKEIVESILREDVWNEKRTNLLTEEISKVLEGKLSPYSLAFMIVNSFNKA